VDRTGLEIGVNFNFYIVYVFTWGTRWRYKPEVRGIYSRWCHWIFSWLSPSGLGSTQTLPKMSTRNISWGGKDYRCVGLTNWPPSFADCLEIWESQPSGNLRACPDLYRYCFTFTFMFLHRCTNVLQK